MLSPLCPRTGKFGVFFSMARTVASGFTALMGISYTVTRCRSARRNIVELDCYFKEIFQPQTEIR